MFDKFKARMKKLEETNENVHKVMAHLRTNKKSYYVGAGCLGVGFATGKYFQRPIEVTVENIIENAPVFNNNNIGNHLVNHVVNNAGPCTKIVQRLSDKAIFEQAGDAAFDISERYGITYDRARWMLSRHLNGFLDDVFGETYKTIGLGTAG